MKIPNLASSYQVGSDRAASDSRVGSIWAMVSVSALARRSAGASADAGVGEAAGEPAADVDTGDLAGAIALEGQGPVAGRRVVQGARTGQRPEVRADRIQQLHAPLAEEARKGAVERFPGVGDGQLGVQFLAAVASGAIDCRRAGAGAEQGALVLEWAVHPQAALAGPQSRAAAPRGSISLDVEQFRGVAVAQAHLPVRSRLDARRNPRLRFDVGAQPVGGGQGPGARRAVLVQH